MSTCASANPLLIYEQRGLNRLLCPFAPTKNSLPAKNIPDISKKIILASHYGWLIVADSEDHAAIFLFHPFSRASVDLPRLDLSFADIHVTDPCSNFVLTCTPDDDDLDEGRCVLLISYKSLLVYCRVGYDDSWQSHNITVEVDGVSSPVNLYHFQSLAICNGIIYGLAVKELLLLRIQIHNQDPNSKLSVSVNTATRLSVKNVSNYQSPRVLARLVESDGDLYCVMAFNGHGDHINFQDVRVTKLIHKNTNTDDNFDITKVENLGNQSLFACSNGSFGCYIPPSDTNVTSSGLSESLHLQKNCVYITSCDTRSIYVYRLQDRNLAIVHLLPNEKMPWDRLLWVKSPPKKRFMNQNCNYKGINHVEEKASMETQAKIDGTQLGELPSELIALVAKRLQLSSHSRFRATCKEFRNVVPPLPSWFDKRAKIEFLEVTTSRTVLPWLLFFTDDGKLGNLIDPIHTNDRYLMTTSWGNLYDAMDVVYAKDGQLLIYGESGNIFFYNPFTKVMTSTKHPENQINGHLQCIGSTTVPDSNNCTDGCTIIGLYKFDQLLVSSYVCGGDNTWYNFPPRENRPFIAADNSPVYYKGAFYFLDIRGYLARYRMMTDGTHHWKVLSKPAKPASINFSAQMTTYLLEYQGTLLSVFVGHLGRWVNVFQLDSIRSCWNKVDNLEGYMIFVSPRSSFAKLAPTSMPEFGNKVYFPRLYRDKLVCYDIQFRIYCTPMGSPIEDFSETREILRGVWIEPRWT
ncbi:hypothetical protein RND81_09G235300 [Saponaria officinalis]|uniref:F-box domain-containing protein n=1 Tax=Saponaria officinalis TaxID=3572 RepID=A0AAW1IS56_SAPOF